MLRIPPRGRHVTAEPLTVADNLLGAPLATFRRRAGGYSASAATALLGFLEMIWDPNRQTLHDRIAATVVLRAR